VKEFLKKLASLGTEVNHPFDSGMSIAGANLGLARHSYAARSEVALDYCKELSPQSVLDVGSGGGHHADAFASGGAQVTCIDFGTSVYATVPDSLSGPAVIRTDFNTWQPDKNYSLVWTLHVLEHQRNVTAFLERLISCAAHDGHVATTVPFPHRRLWGGHLSLWTPGLLAYNIVLCGVDLISAKLLYGYRETSIIFQPIRHSLPELTFDSEDVTRLAQLPPLQFGENRDAWF